MEMKFFKKEDEIELGQRKIANDVYFLKSGTIKIVSLSSDGEEILKYIIKRGDIFGILNLMEVENDDDYAVAMEDSIICIIDSNYFKKMMEENRKLNNYIFKLAGVQIKKLERNLASLIYKDAKTRIEHFIKDYVKDVGEEEEDFFVVKNLLSNNDIGKLTSTSRQTVNRTLNSLKRHNIIDFDKNMIRINKNILQNNIRN
jgi:CRP/FNR family transcriptional regulator